MGSLVKGKITKRSGVYKWTNLVNGKVYIGSAARGILTRYKEHIRDLSNGKCHNRYLQYSWNKYGSGSFEFSVIEICDPVDCEKREVFWIGEYNALDRKCGYNICTSAKNHLGVKRSKETIAKLKKKKMTDYEKAKLIERNKARKGKATEKEREAHSIAAKKAWQDPEERARRIAVRAGKSQTDEHKAKKAESLKRYHSNRKLSYMIDWLNRIREDTSDRGKDSINCQMIPGWCQVAVY
jgi:group I intron endonuclease